MIKPNWETFGAKSLSYYLLGPLFSHGYNLIIEKELDFRDTDSRGYPYCTQGLRPNSLS